MFFKDANPTGVEGTCKWCGDKLETVAYRTVEHEYEVPDYSKGVRTKIQTKTVSVKRKVREVNYGKADEHFCCTFCGYQFGVAMADDGMKLASEKHERGERE